MAKKQRASLTSKYYVYTLAHPDGTVFYVGKGTKDRINAHCRNARNGLQSYTCHTIRKIWAADCEVLQTKVAFFDDEDAAYQFEMHLITFFGRENLTNHTDGGEGGGGRPSLDRVARTYTIDRRIAEYIDGLEDGKRSEFVNSCLKMHPTVAQLLATSNK